MYPTRIACRPQAGSRIARQAGPSCSRAMSSGFFPAPFLGGSRHGFNPFTNSHSGSVDLAPIIRLVDDATRAFDSSIFGAPARRQDRARHQEVWQPRFDVREVDDAYELRGELPGVESKNLDVEFADANTLVIRGRTESEHTSGTAHPEAVQATEPAATPAANDAEASDTASVHSNDSTSSYVKPSVEDENETTADSSNTTKTVAAAIEPTTNTEKTVEQSQQQPEEATPHYWLNERSTGSFQRTFAFAARVDHDGVTASLRNGILNVTVPKAPEPAARKINVN